MKNSIIVISVLLALTSCKKDHKPTSPTEQHYSDFSGTQTIEIGEQVWTVINFSGDGGVYPNVPNYNIILGKLYTVKEAGSIKLKNGWRLPSKADVEKLYRFAGSNATWDNDVLSVEQSVASKLMVAGGWSVFTSNELGFNALPTQDDDNLQEVTYLCSGNELCTYSFMVNADGTYSSQMVCSTSTNSSLRFSLRFVKDK